MRHATLARTKMQWKFHLVSLKNTFPSLKVRERFGELDVTP